MLGGEAKEAERGEPQVPRSGQNPDENRVGIASAIRPELLKNESDAKNNGDDCESPHRAKNGSHVRGLFQSSRSKASL